MGIDGIYKAKVLKVFPIYSYESPEAPYPIEYYVLIKIADLELICFDPNKFGFTKDEEVFVKFHYSVGHWQLAKDRTKKITLVDNHRAYYAICGEVVEINPHRSYEDQYEIIVNCGVLVTSTAYKRENLKVGDFVETDGSGNGLDVLMVFVEEAQILKVNINPEIPNKIESVLLKVRDNELECSANYVEVGVFNVNETVVVKLELEDTKVVKSNKKAQEFTKLKEFAKYQITGRRVDTEISYFTNIDKMKVYADCGFFVSVEMDTPIKKGTIIIDFYSVEAEGKLVARRVKVT